MTNKLNFAAVKEAVSTARSQAQREAKRHGRTVRCGFVRSRGTLLATLDKQGQCEPYPAGDCPEWGGTKREIEQTVAKVLADYPAVTEIIIEGGFDIADNIAFDDYEPRVSEWAVYIWVRAEGGYTTPRTSLDVAQTPLTLDRRGNVIS